MAKEVQHADYCSSEDDVVEIGVKRKNHVRQSRLALRGRKRHNGGSSNEWEECEPSTSRRCREAYEWEECEPSTSGRCREELPTFREELPTLIREEKQMKSTSRRCREELSTFREELPTLIREEKQMKDAETQTSMDCIDLSDCPVCLDSFSDENPLLVTGCGHAICQKCHNCLAKPTARENMISYNCHICRKGIKRNQPPIQVKFLSSRTIAKSQRIAFKKKIDKIRTGSVKQLLAKLAMIITVEQERHRHFTLPAFACKRSIDRSRQEYFAALSTDRIRDCLLDLKLFITDIDKSLVSISKKIENVPQNFDIDMSYAIAQAMVKVMRKNKWDKK